MTVSTEPNIKSDALAFLRFLNRIEKFLLKNEPDSPLRKSVEHIRRQVFYIVGLRDLFRKSAGNVLAISKNSHLSRKNIYDQLDDLGFTKSDFTHLTMHNSGFWNFVSQSHMLEEYKALEKFAFENGIAVPQIAERLSQDIHANEISDPVLDGMQFI